jgi:hypothetical protein
MATETRDPSSAHPAGAQFRKGMANIAHALESALQERGVQGSAVTFSEGSESAGADFMITVADDARKQHFSYEEIEDSGEAIDAPAAVKVRMLVSHFVR